MSDSNKVLHKLVNTLSNADPLDPGLELMNGEKRSELTSAGDEIEAVLTHTLPRSPRIPKSKSVALMSPASPTTSPASPSGKKQ